MRTSRTILLALAFVILAVACQRRPFSEDTTAVQIRMNISTEVKHNHALKLPETMRIDLFDIETGETAYTDYISPEGGYIYPRPGKYDLVVYNIGTESTVIRNDRNRQTVEAYTNEVSAYIKSQMEQFLSKRAELRKQMASQAAETKDSETKDPLLEGTERIVNEPDHLFVGHIPSLTIPAMEIDEDRVITLEVQASSVVETWKISVTPVEGLQWISTINALITGQVESNYIGLPQRSDGVATIYFEMSKNIENQSLVGYFNTFGKNPLYSSFLSLDLNIIDNAGDEHHYHFDLTDQFFENDEFHLIVEDPIVIEEPKVSGGGFAPSVGEWEDVTTDIEL